jgi:hypothetical protein
MYEPNLRLDTLVWLLVNCGLVWFVLVYVKLKPNQTQKNKPKPNENLKTKQNVFRKPKPNENLKTKQNVFRKPKLTTFPKFFQ